MSGWKLPKAKGMPPSPSARMNKTEARYADHLEALRLRGEILRWEFEAVKLRLANNTWYTPDFLVQLADQTIRFDEVKGFWREDARVKIKVAAETFPLFKFNAVTHSKRDGWRREEFG